MSNYSITLPSTGGTVTFNTDSGTYAAQTYYPFQGFGHLGPSMGASIPSREQEINIRDRVFASFKNLSSDARAQLIVLVEIDNFESIFNPDIYGKRHVNFPYFQHIPNISIEDLRKIHADALIDREFANTESI